VNISDVLLQKVVDKAYGLRPLITHGRNVHFSFLVRKGRIRAVGWNNPNKTHPFPAHVGYAFPYIHSEWACLKMAQLTNQELTRSSLVNIRIDKRGRLNLSRPCEDCAKLIKFFDIVDVVYSNEIGGFTCEKM
jgi:hypothetical protein